MKKWIRMESEETAETGWDMIEKQEQAKDQERLERERAEREQEAGEESEEDQVCAQFKNALFKINKIDVDDTIGAMYDAPYYGRVIEKNPGQIKVQFYTRRKNSTTDYLMKKKDIDDISEVRQGYIFYHLDKKYVDYIKDGKTEIMRLLGTYDNDKLDDMWEKWNINAMKLRGQNTAEIEATVDENESKRGKRRSRKSVIDRVAESPTKRTKTESVLESLEQQSTPPPSNDGEGKVDENGVTVPPSEITAQPEPASPEK